MTNEERKLILSHYRRSRIGEVESDTIEFSVILEKNGKRVRVGQHYTDGTDIDKPREIFQLLEDGWKLIAVESCYKWCWNARRYVSEWEAHNRMDQDCYGRYFVTDLWCGWYDKVDIFTEKDRQHFEGKYYHNTGNDREVIKIKVPDEIQKLIEGTEWMQEGDVVNKI